MTRQSVTAMVLVVIVSTLLGLVAIGVLDAAIGTRQAPLTVSQQPEVSASSEPTPAQPVEPAPAARDESTQRVADSQLTADVETWATEFSSAHVDRNLEYLEQTLNPAVADAYGQEICTAYIAETAGSVRSVRVLNVDHPASYSLPSPVGDLRFEDAVEVVARWTITNTGEEAVAEFHLIPSQAGFTWLTTCGQRPPG